METQESKINPVTPQNSGEPRNEFRGHESGRTLAGLVILAIGGALLAKQVLDIDMPWLFSWPMLLVAIGIYIGAKHSFRNPVWIIPVIIGSAFLINNYYWYFNVARYMWPVIIITIGLVMIFKSRRRSSDYYKTTFRDGYSESQGNEDVIDCVTIFGGIKKNIISKDFKGGEAITFFGGTELNLMQADASQRIVLELTQVFGGTKLIIPPHWKVNAEEMVTIFGGLNDKRPMPIQTTTTDSKIIVIKGTCIFGGIDIKSY